MCCSIVHMPSNDASRRGIDCLIADHQCGVGGGAAEEAMGS
jgi:hypothetical protein